MARVDRSAYQQFRAPREQGQSLVDPAWDQLLPLVDSNRRLAAELPYDFGPMPLAELRAAARFSLLFAATGRTTPDPLERPLILSGHQPELFHPGVWFKNFVLDQLARESEGWGVNLVIDSDLCRAPSINVPTGEAAAPRVDALPFDAASAPLPFEQRRVLERAVLSSFPARVAEALSGLIDQPLVSELWPRVTAAVDEGQPLGAAIAAARHALELDWGLANSEAPISAVCDASPFRWFALDLLFRLDDFHRAHNQALAEYRTAHKIRTPAQPIPDLHARDGWLEAPFWVWTDDQPERRPLFAKREAGRLVLSDLAGGEWPIADAGNSDSANFDRGASALADLRLEHGVKIRSRALVTTMFARLLLADVFIHGIGGAKYDQVADRAAELYFGFAPPPHATATATLQLPVPHAPRISRDRPREIAAELRLLKYHPERLLEPSPVEAAPHIESKRRWVQTEKTHANAAERHRAIESANAALQPFVERRRAELLAEQARAGELLRTAAVLESREYAFCLFPADWLREQMRQVIAQAS